MSQPVATASNVGFAAASTARIAAGGPGATSAGVAQIQDLSAGVGVRNEQHAVQYEQDTAKRRQANVAEQRRNRYPASSFVRVAGAYAINEAASREPDSKTAPLLTADFSRGHGIYQSNMRAIAGDIALGGNLNRRF